MATLRKEFLVYIKWALRQHPDVPNADELLDITFQKGLIPAMRETSETTHIKPPAITALCQEQC